MADQDVFLQRALMQEGLLNAEQLDAARRYSAEHGVDLVEGLVATEVVTSRQIALIKADVCEVPYVELGDYETCYANTALIPREISERYGAFPLFMIDGVLTVAMDDPLNLDATDQIRRLTRCEVDAVLAPREQIRSLIAKAYSLGHARPSGTDAVAEVETEDDGTESSAPVVAAVNSMLADAVQQRASDIHINPDEHELHLRYRVDGVLQEKQGPPLSMHAGIVQRLKVMSHLDLTQTRRPQDGKFRFRHGGQTVDVRLSTIPTVSGENVVLRLLANAQTYQDFLELGMPAPLATQFEDLIKQPHGMVLVTGPTGSGKTTSLYTAIGRLNDPSRNIMTIEDPVEIRLPYVRQIQVNTEINLTFATALRSILRQDPDIVLVGEIRDNETATIALQAALTGHLVLSTLHTNDAVGAISRLRDYGLPAFVINSAVLGVMAQRLVRRVCQHCTTPDTLTDLVRHRFDLPADSQGFVRGKGCGRCVQTGYRGRVGLYEFLKFSPEIKRVVEEGGSTERIRTMAMETGMRLMWQEGLEKARLGQTTLEEVTKVASVTNIIRRPAPAPVANAERMIA
ncbi:MAG: Flp pilus assembly complex ATPase component TadA [Phycisphaerales bacterium]|nr:Flp pilus assembly complex ATPase component TadA [Phycisphaerae bacterium]NNF43330.1 Flp pilus assembly complex ATPase component TadA [Phycisphaerales bacterium]NNM25846.1 Flp pilus assembly complex ATPase component TadA [Phycisphaerales bacterium]